MRALFTAAVFGSLGTSAWAQPPLASARYALILEDAPVAKYVATRVALASPEATAKRRGILRAQASLTAVLKERHIFATGSADTLLNAIFVLASPSREEELRTLNGVVAVARMPVFRRSLNKALDLVNAPVAWPALGGQANAGTGVKIAILDSGIDENHPGMKDPAMKAPASYPKFGNADDATHTNGKVIVARSFVASLALGTGQPETTFPDDLSVRDRVGHGTAVAMIAAGVSHVSPLGPISGVAPKAWLGNYKILGSPGVNDTTTADVVLLALNAAYQDGMDIAVLPAVAVPASWAQTDQGATCGKSAGVPCDAFAAAVSLAIQNGMLVVLPAGNEGANGTNTIASPGDVALALTVGASTNAHVVTSTLSTPAGDKLGMRFSDGPQMASPLRLPMIPAAALTGTEFGCGAFPAASLTNKIVLESDGQCGYAAKVLNAQAAGAAAVVLFPLAAATPIGSPIGLGNTAISSVMVSNASGIYLRGYLAAHPNALVTLDPAAVESAATPNSVAPFSSRGPNPGDSGIKPDLVAPGASIYTATQSYDPNGILYASSGYVGVDGTSFSAAFVAGAAALVKQVHPSWTSAQIKSAIVNTASATVLDSGVSARVGAAGAGLLNVAAAVSATISAEPATVSFGPAASSAASRTVTISNLGVSTATLQLSVEQRDAGSKASVVVTPSTLNLAAGQAQAITLTLGATPAPGSYEGYVTIAGGGTPLRIPYLYLVSDGVPATLIPVMGSGFVSETGSPVDLMFRVIDQFGVPVPNVPVRFAPTASVYGATPASDKLGIAEAYMLAPATAGDTSFAATLAVNASRVQFNGRARNGPQIAANGVLDAASFQSLPGFAPGSYLTIFGTGLSESLGLVHTPYLPLSLGGVSVSFDNAAANIHVPGRPYFVSSGQINLQIPWELAGVSSAVVKVTLSGSSSRGVRPEDSGLRTFQSQLVTIPIASYSAAFFQYTDGAGNSNAAALDENYSLIGTANPVARGRVAQFFLNGLGAVSGAAQVSGEPATIAPPYALTLATPTVSIGGQMAPVQFSGLAPGLVGLYQVNAVVPESIDAGLQPVGFSIGGVSSPPTQIAVK